MMIMVIMAIRFSRKVLQMCILSVSIDRHIAKHLHFVLDDNNVDDNVNNAKRQHEATPTLQLLYKPCALICSHREGGCSEARVAPVRRHDVNAMRCLPVECARARLVLLKAN